MLNHLFRDHPASVGETYLEHAGVAASFGATMILGGLGAMLHAVVPALCETTGSRTIARLHARMVAKREAVRADQTQVRTVEYII